MHFYAVESCQVYCMKDIFEDPVDNIEIMQKLCFCRQLLHTFAFAPRQMKITVNSQENNPPHQAY